MRLTHLLVMCFDFSLSFMVNSVLINMTLPTCQSFKVIFNEHEEKKTAIHGMSYRQYIFLYDKCHIIFL